jgi:HSP20 family protein
MKMKKLTVIAAFALLMAASSSLASDRVDLGNAANNSPDFGAFHQNMERRFQNIMTSFFNEAASPMAAIQQPTIAYPRADVVEKEKEVEVSIDLPGIKKDDVEVLVFEDTLTLKVTQQSQKNEKNSKGYYLSERHLGSFQRVIPLPAYVDFESAKSDYKDGVLTVTIPKAKEQKNKFKKLSF